MRVLIVDDHPLLRSAVAELIKREEHVDEVDQCGSIADALAAVQAAAPDLSIVDLMLPDGAGVEAVVALRRAAPQCPVLVLAADVRRETVDAAFAVGARGFVPKGAPPATLLAAIRVVLEGETYVPPQILPSWNGDSPVRGATEGDSPVRLTARQQDVLLHVVRGLSNKEIARELAMSTSTVRVHVSAVFRALSVENRTQAAMHPEAQKLLSTRASF